MIKEEDKKQPLSDRILTEKLNKNGINISRRAVTKYREALGIVGTSKRRQF